MRLYTFNTNRAETILLQLSLFSGCNGLCVLVKLSFYLTNFELTLQHEFALCRKFKAFFPCRWTNAVSSLLRILVQQLINVLPKDWSNILELEIWHSILRLENKVWKKKMLLNRNAIEKKKKISAPVSTVSRHLPFFFCRARASKNQKQRRQITFFSALVSTKLFFIQSNDNKVHCWEKEYCIH